MIYIYILMEESTNTVSTSLGTVANDTYDSINNLLSIQV